MIGFWISWSAIAVQVAIVAQQVAYDLQIPGAILGDGVVAVHRRDRRFRVRAHRADARESEWRA
jgi:hypothetical protein